MPAASKKASYQADPGGSGAPPLATFAEGQPALYYPIAATGPKRAARGRIPLWAFALAGVLVFLMMVIPAATFGLVQWVQGDRILPGVEVLGVGIGGLTTAEAGERLEARWRAHRIQVGEDKVQRQVSPQALGMALDTETTVRRAHAVGRTLDGLTSLIGQPELLSPAPVWTYDRRVTMAYLEGLRDEVEVPAQDAELAIVDGQAVAVEAVRGRRLDALATVEWLSADPRRALAENRLPLVLTEVPPAVVDAGAAVEAANQHLATTFVLELFDPVSGQVTEVIISPSEWRDWLSLEVTDVATSQFRWHVDRSRLDGYLEAASASLGADLYVDAEEAVEAVDRALSEEAHSLLLQVRHRPKSHIVQPGETLASIGRAYGMPYPWIQQANPQLGDGLWPGQAITIPSRDVLLPLPAVPGKRVVVSMTEQRVRVYEASELRWDWPASTGITSSPTAPGVFQVQSHELNAYAANWDLHMPHFIGVYRPVPTSDFMNGFHGFPTRDGRTLLWTGDLGRAVTFGCILLSSDNAAALYEWAEAGVVVEILP
jgi:LysM repeat protein